MANEPPAPNEHFPIVRGPDAVFIYVRGLTKMAETLPQNIQESFATAGIPDVKIIGGPKIYNGYPSILANGNSIEFPGNLIARRPDDDPAWHSLVAAVREGKFFVEYSPASLFNVVAEVVRSFGIYDGSIIASGLAPLKSGLPALPPKADRPPERVKDSDLPDANGVVADPTDKAAYREAAKLLKDFPGALPTHKALTKILAGNPGIRRWKPRSNRLLIHLGDWQKYLDGKQGSESQDDPNEIERRKGEIRRNNEKKWKFYFRPTSNPEAHFPISIE
jgi:hypothetical protein